MQTRPHSQQDVALSLLKQKGMASISELNDAGAAGTTISRMVETA